MMTDEDLENFTKDHAHHGVNEMWILKKFMAYASTCSDPQNIFRYMEEKAICTFLSSYWISKAEYLADIGDYTDCFECIEIARSRNGIGEDQNEEVASINQKEADLVNKFMNEMRTFPLKSKRTVEEYQFATNQCKKTNEKYGLKSTYEKILPIYQSKYGGLRKQKEKLFKLERQKLPQSWLAEQYEKQEIQEKKIEDKIHQNSIKLSKEVKYHSMHTPVKFRDPQRLTKTMDSVEILRKKRSTNEKLRNNRTFQNYDSDDDFEAFQKSNTKMVASVPVGKTMSNLKRRVTFDMMELRKNGVKFSEVKTSPEFALSSNSLKNVTNSMEEPFSADKNEDQSQKFKSLPSAPQKLK